MKKIIAVLGLLMGLFMAAGCTKDTEKQVEIISSNQMQYLKDHEEKIADFVKSYGGKEIDEVEFHWDSADVNIFPKKTQWIIGRYIYLPGSYNGLSNTYFGLAIWVNNNGEPNLDKICFLTEPLFETV